jgi:hypothetical protein
LLSRESKVRGVFVYPNDLHVLLGLGHLKLMRLAELLITRPFFVSFKIEGTICEENF